MFEKFYEEVKNDQYLKLYKCNQSYDVVYIIDQVQNTDALITSVYMEEVGDIGTKTFEGDYKLSDFYLKYNQINKTQVESVTVNLQTGTRLYLKPPYLSLFSKENVELGELLSSGVKRNL